MHTRSNIPSDLTPSPGPDGKIHILSTINFTPAQLERLAAVHPDLAVDQISATGMQDLAQKAQARGYDLAQVQALYAGHTLAPGPGSRPPAWAKLDWVQLHSAGYDHILGSWLSGADGPRVTNASGIHATQIGEYIMATLLAWHKRLPRAGRMQQAGSWSTDRWAQFARPELPGQTLGIVGYGAIGRHAAQLAQAFGLRVVALKQNPAQRAFTGFAFPGEGDATGAIPAAWYGLDGLADMVADCDFVVLALPLTKETRHIVDAAVLRAMRPNAMLINVGRGGLIDEAALIHSLQTKAIGGAALDVFSQEPLPDESPLWQIDPDRLIMTPHISGFTLAYDEKASQLFAANLARWLRGEPMFNLIRFGQ